LNEGRFVGWIMPGAQHSIKGVNAYDVITVHDAYSLVEVPEGMARKVAKGLNRSTIKGNRVKVRPGHGH
jgi:DbpA RNA binding domain.